MVSLNCKAFCYPVRNQEVLFSSGFVVLICPFIHSISSVDGLDCSTDLCTKLLPFICGI